MAFDTLGHRLLLPLKGGGPWSNALLHGRLVFLSSVKTRAVIRAIHKPITHNCSKHVEFRDAQRVFNRKTMDDCF